MPFPFRTYYFIISKLPHLFDITHFRGKHKTVTCRGVSTGELALRYLSQTIAR